MYLLSPQALFWKKSLFLTFATSGGDGSPNLAWEIIRGFISLWGHQDQGLCISLPQAAEEGLRFFMILVDLSFIFNMRNATSPIYMTEHWIDKQIWVKWKDLPMISDPVYQEWKTPPA